MNDPKATAELCHGFHALYVEDEEAVRAPMAATLGQLFGTLSVAGDGRQALAVFERDRPDLLITDIRMPVMDGFELIERARVLDRSLPVLLISAHNDTEYYARAIRLGIDGFVLKPIELEQLLGVLSAVARRLRERRELDGYRADLERMIRERTDELAHRLITDELTGLPNRNRLRQDLQGCREGAAIQINLDGLARINTGFGLETGDWVLQQTAALLVDLVPTEARVYRLAGDEFLVLLPEGVLAEGRRLGESIKENLANQTLSLDADTRIPVIHTLGIGAGAAELLLEQARLAVAEARSFGRNRLAVHVGGSSLASKEQKTLNWIHRVRQALREDRILVHYQPIFDNRSGRQVKYEALIRMVENGELIPPNHFIAFAQLGGLMPELTARVLDQVLLLLGERGGHFSVNLTSDDLLDGTLLRRLRGEIAAGRIEPAQLTFEVLEGITLDESGEAIAALLELERMGFSVAIDDFGAEQSHFSRIPTLRADTLKIDGQFIRDIDTNPSSRLITRAIVQLAKGLGIEVVAEFVHSEVIQRLVEELGIEYSQGYYLGEPRAISRKADP